MLATGAGRSQEPGTSRCVPPTWQDSSCLVHHQIRPRGQVSGKLDSREDPGLSPPLDGGARMPDPECLMPMLTHWGRIVYLLFFFEGVVFGGSCI